MAALEVGQVVQRLVRDVAAGLALVAQGCLQALLAVGRKAEARKGHLLG